MSTYPALRAAVVNGTTVVFDDIRDLLADYDRLAARCADLGRICAGWEHTVISRDADAAKMRAHIAELERRSAVHVPSASVAGYPGTATVPPRGAL